jgi:uncharacterized protein (DUF433 family)
MTDHPDSIESVTRVSTSAQLYEPNEVARLLQMRPSRVRRWLFGYQFEYRSRKRQRTPLVHRAKPEVRYASFLDLVELLFARAFLGQGISVQRMRRALDEARDVLSMDHPFSRQMFFTDGKELYLTVRSRSGVPSLLQLLSGGQWVIAPVVLQYARQIDFAKVTGEAERWWPMGRAVPVVLDPAVSFGAPTLADTGIRTAVVYDLYLAEGRRASTVATWMGIEPATVQAAVRYEEDYFRRAA